MSEIYTQMARLREFVGLFPRWSAHVTFKGKGHKVAMTNEAIDAYRKWLTAEGVQGAHVGPATENCAPSTKSAHLRDIELETHTHIHTLPPRESHASPRCANPGGRDEVSIFDAEGVTIRLTPLPAKPGEPPAAIRLRQLLKLALRGFRFRASWAPATPPKGAE